MSDISLTLFDFGVLFVVGLSALLSFFRGFLREFISLAAWLGASVITLRTLPMVSHYLEPRVGSTVVASGIAAVAIFFTTLIAISMVSGLLLKLLKPGAKVGLFDNLAGLCFGVARGVLIVAIAYFIMGIVLLEKDFPKAVTASQARPYIARVATWVGTLTPSALDAVTAAPPGTADAPPAKVVKTIDDAVDDLPDADTPEDSMPSIEDLKQRIREENEKNDVR
ncbi:MAG: CvpA family protein [Alphaproteobacteria bacterium]|nr:CvpA family protein [Alphaproteobacteria bacterium]